MISDKDYTIPLLENNEEKWTTAKKENEEHGSKLLGGGDIPTCNSTSGG